MGSSDFERILSPDSDDAIIDSSIAAGAADKENGNEWITRSAEVQQVCSELPL